MDHYFFGIDFEPDIFAGIFTITAVAGAAVTGAIGGAVESPGAKGITAGMWFYSTNDGFITSNRSDGSGKIQRCNGAGQVGLAGAVGCYIGKKSEQLRSMLLICVAGQF